jgi:hypothetical protein
MHCYYFTTILDIVWRAGPRPASRDISARQTSADPSLRIGAKSDPRHHGKA